MKDVYLYIIIRIYIIIFILQPENAPGWTEEAREGVLELMGPGGGVVKVGGGVPGTGGRNEW